MIPSMTGHVTVLPAPWWRAAPLTSTSGCETKIKSELMQKKKNSKFLKKSLKPYWFRGKKKEDERILIFITFHQPPTRIARNKGFLWVRVRLPLYINIFNFLLSNSYNKMYWSSRLNVQKKNPQIGMERVNTMLYTCIDYTNDIS